MGANLPPSDPSRQHVDELVALLETIRRLAFATSAAPVEQLGRIRDAIHQADGEFDQE